MAAAVILACEMIEDEVRLALDVVPAPERPPVVWVESGLHDRPERLHDVLQGLVDLLDEGSRTGETALLPSLEPGRGAADERRTEVAVDPVEEVILALGFCGKGLLGLMSERLTLRFPRVDDCIALFLNTGCSREEIARDGKTYYLTGGWFDHDSSVTQAFEDWSERYGPERAAALRKAMFRGYERVHLIDTGAYEVADYADRCRRHAADVDLEPGVAPGSVQLLERLFKREEDSEIVVVPPGEPVGFAHLLQGRS